MLTKRYFKLDDSGGTGLFRKRFRLDVGKFAFSC